MDLKAKIYELDVKLTEKLVRSDSESKQYDRICDLIDDLSEFESQVDEMIEALKEIEDVVKDNT